LNAIRRGKSKLSGRLVKVNAYDLQRTIKYEDNRTGWRKFPLHIQRIFRDAPQESWGENSRFDPKENKILFSDRSTKLIAINRQRRTLNRAYDLVCVELNPGEGGKPGKKSKSGRKGNNNQNTRVKNLANGAVVRQQRKGGPISATSESHSPEAGAYLRSVLAPCAGNARIPDLNTIPTVLATLTQELSSTVNASGVGGINFGIYSNVPQYLLENPATTTDGAFTYNAAVNMTAAGTFTNTYSFCRVVSACLDVTFTGATLSDQGIMVGWTTSCFNGVLETSVTSLASAQSYRMNQTNRTKDGMSVFYRPNDASSFLFKSTGATNSFGLLGVHMTGLAASAPFSAKLTVNYECIPALDTIFAATTNNVLKNSPVDVPGYSKAVSYASQVRPFTTAQNAVKLTNSLSTIGNNLSTIWAAGKAIFGGMSYGSKLLI
jgi:hypothetical protein